MEGRVVIVVGYAVNVVRENADAIGVGEKGITQGVVRGVEEGGAEREVGEEGEEGEGRKEVGGQS